MRLRKTLSILLVSLFVLTLVPVKQASATFGECTVGTACAFKDVYDNNAAAYNPVQITGIEGDQYVFRIGFWNTTGAPINNVTFHDTLPSGLTYTMESVAIAGYTGSYDDENLFNGTGINVGTVANAGSIQLTLLARVNDLPEGQHTLTNQATVTWTGGSKTDTAAIIVDAEGPVVSEGELLINEINHNPRADWNGGSSYTLSNRTAINADDEWIEIYVNNSGLNLTDSRWVLTIANTGGGFTSTNQILAAGAAYEYIGAGSVSNTQAGAYLLITNPLVSLSDDASIGIDYDGSAVDGMSYASTNTNLLDETIGRNAVSADTNNNGDFSRNHATPGRANDQRSATRFEAEIYSASSTGNEHGRDVADGAASRGIASRLESASDLNGTAMQISSADQNAAGRYRATLRLKSENADLNGTAPFAELLVHYDNGSGGYHTIGYAIRGRDMQANGTYQDFNIEFRKGATAANTVYEINFVPAGATNITVDYLDVVSITPNMNLPQVYEGENMHFRTGFRANDSGTAVAFGPKGEADSSLYMSYGPYTSNHINGIGAGQFMATYRMRFANITGAAGDGAVRIEVHNRAANIYRERVLRVQDISGSYQDFGVSFPSTGQGSLEFRVINLGAADVYFDRVTVTAASAAAITYESETDFEYPIAPVSILNNGAASGGQEVKADTASNAEGFLIRGPHAYDQTGTGKFYEAAFRLRTDAPSTSSDPAALLFVRNTDSGEILTSQIVHINTLGTDYRTFRVIFESPTDGRLSFEVYFLRTVNLISDSVGVTELASNPNPRVSQAEQLRRWNNAGSIVEDSSATNSIDHTTGYAIQATNGVNNGQVVMFSDTQEVFPSGNYQADFFVRGTSAGGSSQEIAYLEVWDEFGFVDYYALTEAELNTSYEVYSVPFTKSSNGRIYFKIFFVGGLSNSILVDKVEVSML